jgi:hypothetical protein
MELVSNKLVIFMSWCVKANEQLPVRLTWFSEVQLKSHSGAPEVRVLPWFLTAESLCLTD